MDDPTRWCENDTNKWKRVTPGLLFPSKGPTFLPARSHQERQPILAIGGTALPAAAPTLLSGHCRAIHIDLSKFHVNHPR